MAAAVLVTASISGATEQPPAPIDTRLPAPHFEVLRSGPFSLAGIRNRARPLDPAAPAWARRLYRRSLRVLLALTDPRSGAMIAGERDGWDYVWPRDAAAGAVALESAGLRPEAHRVTGFLASLDLDGAARFYPDGSPVPGRTAAGDGEGWVAAAQEAVTSDWDGTVLPKAARSHLEQDSPMMEWRDRQDYGENVSGDLLGNAIAAGVPAVRDPEPLRDIARPGQGTREAKELDSSAAWAATPLPQPGSPRSCQSKHSSHSLASRPPTASPRWRAGPSARSGPRRLPGQRGPWSSSARPEPLISSWPSSTKRRRRTERSRSVWTPATGAPTSTTPLAWSHAFAILALRARYR